MLTFYPEFEAESPQEVEVVFLLDLSCSMKVSYSIMKICPAISTLDIILIFFLLFCFLDRILKAIFILPHLNLN